ncbi:MAG TPA: ABC-2 family transporter protein [Candidatus Limnocylindria bacterium]|nr:ABC-2 family transporter protein [Candidatus Limnocylindria bacterium]
MIRTYRALLVATVQAAAQYRVQSVLWMLFSVIRPVIFLAAWVAVANAQGGRVGGYDVRDFAGYYVALSLVSQLTMAWDAYEFEFEVRMGRLAPKLLRPLHPIHYAVAWNIVWKLTTIIPLLVVLALVTVSFDVRFRTTPAHVALFVPSVLIGAALAFVSGWVLASVAFWTTRVHAVSSLWDRGAFIFAGQIAPLALLPGPLQVIALALPFGYMLGVPAEILRGGVDVPTGLTLIGGQILWLSFFLIAFQRVWRAGVRQFSAVGA